VAVNRTELVDAVASKTGLEKKHAEAAVAAVAETVVAETKAGNKVAIFGFGTFAPGARAARVGRNPQTGAPVKIAASKVVRFAPASAFKEALNSKGKAAAAKKAAPAKKSAPAKKGAAAKKAAPAKKAAKAAKKR
jgi:DNA-binding protein HU-beta